MRAMEAGGKRETADKPSSPPSRELSGGGHIL